MQKIVLPGEYTDLNAFLKAVNGHRLAGNAVKQEETERTAMECRIQRAKETEEYPVHITYHWYSKNQRIDIDNVAFAKKFINDGLVIAGVLEDDSRKYVAGFSDYFYIDKNNPRVELVIDVVH